MKRFLPFLLSLLFLSALGLALSRFSGAQAAQGTPTPGAPPSLPENLSYQQVYSQVSLSLDKALLDSLRHPDSLAYLIYDVGIHDIAYDLQDGWAVVLLEFRDPETGEVLPTEPGLGLARWTGSEWALTLPNDPDWPHLLPLTPNTLLTVDEKAAWLERSEEAGAYAVTYGPFGGYLLPWEGGETNRLTRSISHGGREYYAFDFAAYTPGNMFPVYAAKGGTVKYVKWWYENGYYDGNCNHANYIVLEDTTTSPTTYQLYLHLAYESIPAELRTHGVYVQQGQYLGMADDTGCSTGHHLHFQVHVPPNWWDTAVDITFDDVSINGGRPRTPAEAASTGEDGQTYYTSGNVVHNPDNTPPQGGLLTPFVDNTTITTRTLTLEGWATDDLSGVASAQFMANYSGTWTSIGPVFSDALTFSYTWDLCAAGVPDGPVSLALSIQDRAHNTSPPLTGLRQVFKHYACPSPPPACQPAAGQVALFAEPNYGGDCTLLNPGDYARGTDLGAVGGRNAASLRLGEGVLATLFSGENFTGRSTTFTAEDPNLADNPVGSDTTQSVRVLPKGGTPSLPLLRWPPAGSILTGSVNLYWQDSGGGIEFQARLSDTLTRTLTSTWQTAPSLPLALPPATYTWQVRARTPFTSGISLTQWSAPYTFTLRAQAAITPAVSLPYTTGMETRAAWMAENWAWSTEPARDGHAWVVSPTLTSASQPFVADLTSPPISVTLPGYALRFWYRANTEGNGTHWDQRWVQVSVDGSPFENLLQLENDPMLGWLHSPEISLTPYVSHTVRLRFHYVTLDGADNPAAPWAVDDLSILPAETYTCTERTPNDSPAAATPLNFGQSFAGDICPPGDLDFFTFQGQAGQKISVDVGAVGAGRGSHLDPYLFLLAEDGVSQLAEHDDEVPYQMQDPHLGFTLPYSGTYYLKLRAWDHPTAGGEEYTYTLRLLEDAAPPTVTLHAPALLPCEQVVMLTATTGDNDAVRQVTFWWHNGDWEQGNWQLVGTDADGRDGWQMLFAPSGLPPQTDMAFYAEAADWADNRAYDGAWHVIYGQTVYLPIIQK